MFQPPVSREVTAQDFVDSWSYNAQAANKSATTYIIAPIKGMDPNTGLLRRPRSLSGVKAIDKYTLQVTLQYPFADFTATPGAPDHRMCSRSTTPRRSAAKAFFEKPVGTGPYMVQDWKHNQSVTLVKNPDYWNTTKSGNSAAPATSTRSTCRSTPTSSTEWLAFQKGTLDYSGRPVRATSRPPRTTRAPKTAPGRSRPTRAPAVYFLSLIHEQAHARRRRQPADPRRSQLRPLIAQAVIQHRQRGCLDPVGRDRPGHASPATSRDLNPYPYDPDQGAGRARQVHRHAAQGHPVLVQLGRRPRQDRPGAASPAGRRPWHRSRSS